MNSSAKTNRLVPAALAAACVAATPATAQIIDPAVAGRAVVRVEPEATVGELMAQLEAQLPGVTFTVADAALSSRRIYLLDYAPATAGDQVEPVVDALENDPGDAGTWGELLYEGHDPEGNTGSVWFHSVIGQASFSTQYASEVLGLSSAHDMAGGAGVVVAVVDGGIDAAHPLLSGHVAPGGFNFVTGSGDTGDAGDGLDNDGDGLTDESVGHGTFVAGLIHLVAPQAELLPVVVLDSDGGGDAWSFARGLFYAIDQGVEVINLSLGSTYNSDAIGDAVEEAKDLGIVVVSAAGNQDLGEDFEQYPASRSNGFGVAAVDDMDVKTEFSNYSPDLFLSAPGDSVPMEGAPDGFDPQRSIYSAVPGGDYAVWEGTSFSTAFVSGVIALLRSQIAELPETEIAYDRVEAVLEQTAVPIDAQNPAYAGQLGVGRLDAEAALLLGAGDLDGSGAVGVEDFLALLAAWGPCPPDTACFADLDGDGAVGVLDFLTLLANWT